METRPRPIHRSKLLRTTIAGALCLGLAASKLRALVSLNDGRDKFFVHGAATFAWDSNVYANSNSQGDYVMSASVGVDYTRRAGLIGVDASVNVNASRYNKFSTEDFRNPSMRVEFTKQTGRTTGSLALSAARESRADPNANLRTHAWNYTAGLNLHYPVIDRYSFSGGVDWSRHKYDNSTTLVNLDSYAANLDLYYIFTQDRDLLTGIRVRRENTSADSHSMDLGYSAGVRGRIFGRLNGSVRFGYETRRVTGKDPGHFNTWTASAATTWNATRRFQVTGSLNKDFNTTSTNATSDSIGGSLDGTYSFNAHLNAGAGIGGGITRFLGVEGANRKDTYFDYNFNVGYSMNDHLKAALQYTYFVNWSTLAYADFVRQGYSLSLSSKW